ncbi:MAG: Stp1/IreP family PP2C-type Ser/Thr phosphatase [Myxococcales bacterium FL481]|nr:MAG: Stp1/IreP family PP2C-type Ser/Thr phosphatase [Myxococcales bacterium FL481]
MRVRYAAKTDVGMKRTHNEDYFSLIEDEQLFLVADGMGGHACGEVASKLASDAIAEFYRHSRNVDATWPYRYDHDLSYVENRLVTAIRSANARIYAHAQSNPARRGMGTTLVGCLIVSNFAYIAHVGDSRCYRVRASGVELLTRDHSLLEDYKEARPDMTEAEAKNFPHKNVITRALGMRETVTVDLVKVEVSDGDRFVLCSDGLSGHLSNDRIAELVQQSPDLETAVDRMIDEANQAGGTDNITTMVVECRY